MASGGTRPAGFAFKLLRIKTEGNRVIIYCPLYLAVWLNFVTSLSGLPIIQATPLLFAKHQIAVCGSSDRVEDMDKLEIFFDYI